MIWFQAQGWIYKWLANLVFFYFPLLLLYATALCWPCGGRNSSQIMYFLSLLSVSHSSMILNLWSHGGGSGAEAHFQKEFGSWSIFTYNKKKFPLEEFSSALNRTEQRHKSFKCCVRKYDPNSDSKCSDPRPYFMPMSGLSTPSLWSARFFFHCFQIALNLNVPHA